MQIQALDAPVSDSDACSHYCLSHDVSASGIRLVADHSYPLDTQVLLTMECRQNGWASIISRVGSVVWARPDESGQRCQLGIRFTDVDEAEVEETETADVDQPEEPEVPQPRQRRPVVVVQALDKITAETMRFEVEVGGRPVRFNNALIVTARACEVSAADERDEEAAAYLEVSLQPRGAVQPQTRQLFRGWMFASTPGLSTIDHPVYDAWVVGCRA